MRKIWLEFNIGVVPYHEYEDRARMLDDFGLDALSVGEVSGADPFVAMGMIARATKHVRIGTAIINYFSRSPVSLTMGFNSIDVISGGRAFIGLGSSSPAVIEQLHSVPYEQPVRRLSEYIDIINMLMRGETLKYKGKVFKHELGLGMGGQRVRDHIPVWVASLAPSSIRLTARKADGWLPRHVPREQWKAHVYDLHSAMREFGRDPSEIESRAPGWVYITDDPEGTYESLRRSTQNFMVRMGPFHYAQFGRYGMGEEAAAVRLATREGGTDAGVGMVSMETVKSLHYAGDVSGAIDWMEEQLEAGYDTHNVVVTETDPAKQREIYHQLVG